MEPLVGIGFLDQSLIFLKWSRQRGLSVCSSLAREIEMGYGGSLTKRTGSWEWGLAHINILWSSWGQVQ